MKNFSFSSSDKIISYGSEDIADIKLLPIKELGEIDHGEKSFLLNL